jgi:hypothetical protein
VGWFLSQVWDRFRDRAFYLTQLAVRNVRDHADVVLYLVNASEHPDDVGYLAAELDVLAWIGKPVVVVLNQTGRPRPPDEEQADVERWRRAVGTRPVVHAVTTLDAFARCWVQEIALFRLVEGALPEARRETFRRLLDAWQARRRAQFDEAMAIVAAPIAAAACDREPLPDAGVGGALRDLGRGLGIGRDDGDGAKTRASQALAARLDEALRTSTDKLIALHGLDGRASGEVLARLAAGVAVDAPVDERKAAMLGGVVSGALSGLAADLAAGGFTFGAGMLAGAVLGAIGGAGIARGMNLARGRSGTALRWDDAFLAGLLNAALLRYLAVAHYGRGRGGYVETEYPPFWPPLVAEIVAARRGAIGAVWTRRESTCDEPGDRARPARDPRRRRARDPRAALSRRGNLELALSRREAFGELHALHLARRPLGQRVDEADVAWRLVAAELAQAMRVDLVARERAVGLDDDAREDLLAVGRGRARRPPPPRARPDA